MGKKTPPYKNTGLTQAAFKGLIISALRQKSRYWKPAVAAKKRASVGRMRNKATGKLCIHYICSHCKRFYPDKHIDVDHIEPVVDPNVGFQGWDVYIDRMFCDAGGYQILCKECHRMKTDLEKECRKKK